MSTSGSSVSVVIATLGGDVLRNTIEQINVGSIVPDEIMICIPAAFTERTTDLRYPNVSIVSTDCKGQVQQRIEGFKRATGNYVLQLDDDIHVKKDCLEKLIAVMKEKPTLSAIGPVFMVGHSNNSVYNTIPAGNLFSRLGNWLLSKIQGNASDKQGRITRSGYAFGVDPHKAKERILPVEWLPGGCVLHHKNNLLLENYFPFAGKAFNEDLIHSYHLRKKGISLYIVTDAICGIELEPPIKNKLERLKQMNREFKVRKYFVKLISGSVPLLVVSYLINWSMMIADGVFVKTKRLFVRNK